MDRMNRTHLEEDEIVDVTILNEPEDLARCLAEVADACDVEVADLPDLASREGTIVWERLKACKISLAELTPLSLDSAEAYQQKHLKSKPQSQENFQEKGGISGTESENCTTINDGKEISSEDGCMEISDTVSGTESTEDEMARQEVVVLKKRGRPKGSKNKPKEAVQEFEKVLPEKKVKLPKVPKAAPVEKKFVRAKPLSLSKKVGVVNAIVETLRKATEEKPISKRQIHAVLVKKFGPGTSADKDPLGMWSTLNAQLSTKLKDRGYVLGKTSEGYWLISEA